MTTIVEKAQSLIKLPLVTLFWRGWSSCRRVGLRSERIMRLLGVLALVVALVQGQVVLPIVVHPGLNGTCTTGRTRVILDQLRSVFPAAHIRCIHPFPSSAPDREAFKSFFSSAVDSVHRICRQLQDDRRLRDGFNVIGLSQGGLMMRGYVEMCNRPPVRSLITLGAPHGGINRLPECGVPEMKRLTEDIRDRIDGTRFLPKRLLCRVIRSILQSAAYTSFMQEFILPAQYYRDPKRPRRYQEAGTFLALINNEFPPRNQTFIRNMESLRYLVLVRYDRDQLVRPSYSPWFAYADAKEGVFNITQVPAYEEDWVGLRKLDQSGRLRLITLRGDHLNIPADFVRASLLPFLNTTV